MSGSNPCKNAIIHGWAADKTRRQLSVYVRLGIGTAELDKWTERKTAELGRNVTVLLFPATLVFRLNIECCTLLSR
jgi:hypothetical protein